jgi:hypothetical protein
LDLKRDGFGDKGEVMPVKMVVMFKDGIPVRDLPRLHEAVKGFGGEAVFTPIEPIADRPKVVDQEKKELASAVDYLDIFVKQRGWGEIIERWQCVKKCLESHRIGEMPEIPSIDVQQLKDKIAAIADRMVSACDTNKEPYLYVDIIADLRQLSAV